MNKQRLLEIFRETEVLSEGHFLLTSGRHSANYLQCAKIFQYPAYAGEIAAYLAKQFENDEIDIVIGPALGGIILSYEMGRCLGVKTMFAERDNGVMVIRRGFEIPAHSRVLVVEDVVTTGGSVQEVIELVARHDAQVVGVAVIVDRSNGKVDFGTKIRCAIQMDVASFIPTECSLCKSEVPVSKPGSRIFSKQQ